ncbi:Holliday junction branch migration protein RuvA [Novispirillum sp. DQ9]|uniref:Holliday junction branch migration protein RuvA n=1 Tax=Novispirillum sp. DQ9 TaxID=3398612 RepID=UPI003C7D2271
MIAKLKGRVDSIGDDWAVIDVGGVGYLIFCASRTLGRLPAAGEAVEVFVETHVREDHIHLYGFLSDAERACFRLLTTVQGVGAKVALAILSVAAPEQLAQAIAAQDKATFARASGVGPKLAQRIVTELKDKAAHLALAAPPRMPALAGAASAVAAAAAPAEGGAVEDAVSALVNLGYGRAEAFAAVSRAAQGQEGAATPALIGAALRDLGQGL